MLGNEDFVRWYGCPLMQNQRYKFEEPRFEARAIDDRSLREHRARVELTVLVRFIYYYGNLCYLYNINSVCIIIFRWTA